MKLIDIGANLTNKRFDNDLNLVLERSKSEHVSHIIITGTSVKGSQAAWQLCQQDTHYLSATAGVHPHDAKSWTNESEHHLRALLNHPEVVAVGECGLDYNRDFSPRDQQLTCFEAQLKLATELDKPLFLHQRDAHTPFFELLKKYRSKLSGAVVHCFTGSLEEMEAYVALDCHIGITGWLCDKNRGNELREIVKHIPLEKLMIETDAPYLTPQNLKPKPKGNRNEPAYLKTVLNALAEILNIQEETLAKTIHETSHEFFNLKDR